MIFLLALLATSKQNNQQSDEYSTKKRETLIPTRVVIGIILSCDVIAAVVIFLSIYFGVIKEWNNIDQENIFDVEKNFSEYPNENKERINLV
ncbi:hypothetical protein M9Y10_018803 [Tritrichomonas musculus]|uniref:Uncharacterized protein n=1 Tax=Tritrichomonas musculus TaxID=1915356 RepID=A0ABR2HIQ8_9EUKA